jgi:hypothetical protein
MDGAAADGRLASALKRALERRGLPWNPAHWHFQKSVITPLGWRPNPKPGFKAAGPAAEAYAAYCGGEGFQVAAAAAAASSKMPAAKQAKNNNDSAPEDVCDVDADDDMEDPDAAPSPEQLLRNVSAMSHEEAVQAIKLLAASIGGHLVFGAAGGPRKGGVKRARRQLSGSGEHEVVSRVPQMRMDVSALALENLRQALWRAFNEPMRLHAGEELQDSEAFAKAELLFPSGEALPRCWVDAGYRQG